MLETENLKAEINKIWPKDGPSSMGVYKYLKKYRDEKIIIKCGGSVLLDSNLFDLFIKDIAIMKKLGLTPIVVHGGGPRIKKKLVELNIESTFIRGLRVTDKKIIKIVEAVLIKFNKEIVKALKDQSCKARSLTTKEYNVISVKPARKELGFVGIPNEIRINIINEIINANEIPVLAPMGLDENDLPHNINADTAAGAIAKKLKSRRLLLMTDVEGVYNKEKKLISEITPNQAVQMIKDEVIVGGMIPKVNTCVDAVNNGVRGVVIIDGRRHHSILFELFSDQGSGTLIRK